MRAKDVCQLSIDDMFAALNNAMTEQRLIAQSLKRGSGFEGGKARIVAKYNENRPMSEFADFLCKEYGTGGYGFMQEHQDHSPQGMKIEWREVGNNIKIQMNWMQVAKEITKLIERKEY